MNIHSFMSFFIFIFCFIEKIRSLNPLFAAVFHVTTQPNSVSSHIHVLIKCLIQIKGIDLFFKKYM